MTQLPYTLTEPTKAYFSSAPSEEVSLTMLTPGGQYNFYAYFARKPAGDYAPCPGTWGGVESFVDAGGRRWSRGINRLVVDDFGYLVEVPS